MRKAFFLVLMVGGCAASVQAYSTEKSELSLYLISLVFVVGFLALIDGVSLVSERIEELIVELIEDEYDEDIMHEPYDLDELEAGEQEEDDGDDDDGSYV